MIYLVAARAEGLCKIGYAVDPARRLALLQTATPFDLELVATRPGDHGLERGVHQAVAAYHVKREWFRFAPEVLRLFHEAQPFVPAAPLKRAPLPAAASDLRAIRKSLGLTQAEMAERLGINQSNISRMEKGAIAINRRTLIAARTLMTAECAA